MNEEEKKIIENEDYYDRSGCGPLLLTMLVIGLFLVGVACFFMFK